MQVCRLPAEQHLPQRYQHKSWLRQVMRVGPVISPGPGTHLTVAFCSPELGSNSVST